MNEQIKPEIDEKNKKNIFTKYRFLLIGAFLAIIGIVFNVHSVMKRFTMTTTDVIIAYALPIIVIIIFTTILVLILVYGHKMK